MLNEKDKVQTPGDVQKEELLKMKAENDFYREAYGLEDYGS